MQISEQGTRRTMSEINVTPLVDVMMVLLVIFMVTAPMMQQGVDVNLPQAKGKALPASERIIVTIRKDNKVYINKAQVETRELQKKLKLIFAERENKELFLKADKDVPYGVVAEVMGEIREAGVEKLGMVTEPSSR